MTARTALCYKTFAHPDKKQEEIAYSCQKEGGSLQLIKMKKDSIGQERPFRLDMSMSMVRDKVLR